MEDAIPDEGQGKPRCGARRKDGSGGTCRRGAGAGTDHPGSGSCSLHLGSTRNHQLAAERAQVAELAGRYSVPREVHPLQGVLEQYHRLAGQIAWLEAKVNTLPEDDLFWGVESETDKSGGEGGGGYEVKRKAGPNAYVEQLDKVGRDYARLGVDIIRIGLEAAGDALASKFAANLQRVLDELMVELAALPADADPQARTEQFRTRMVAKIAAFAGARPGTIDGVAA